MIKNILAVGDSFTYGEELEDRTNAWPCLVAAELNATVDNRGIPSGGNTQVVRNIVEHATPDDVVLIGWTSPGRMEFADEEGVYDIWPGYTGKWVRHGRKELVDYINKHYNDEHIYKQYLVNVILAQSFLKLNNIRYIMMPVVSNEYYKNKFKHKFTELRKQVDATYFVDEILGTGMAEWTYGLPQGPNGHFLDDGHRVVANKVLDKIKELGWS
jgi:lysophospholipase L1-like esterase